MFKFLKQKHSPAEDRTIRNIENALQSSARQINSVDPQTEKQWQRLKNALASETAIVDYSSVVMRRFFPKPAIAFAIAIIVLVAFSVIWLRDTSPKIYKTAKGEHSTIVLQDSTEIILNSTSILTVNRFNQASERYVELKGEALFHVRKTGKPFVLTTDIGVVKVLGTHFNVRARDDRMVVAVLSGGVKVTVQKDGKDSSVVLTKGQIISCIRNQFPGQPDQIPFPGYPGWTQGKLMFYRASLAEVCRELESQFDIKIKILNRTDTTTLTGIIDSRNAKAALTTLAELTGKKFRYENESYLLY